MEWQKDKRERGDRLVLEQRAAAEQLAEENKKAAVEAMRARLLDRIAVVAEKVGWCWLESVAFAILWPVWRESPSLVQHE